MIRILLVDDHAVVRNGYRRLIDAEPGLKVVGEAATAAEANACVQREAVDVAVVDLNLKGSSGLDAIQGMLARRPGLKVMVLSMYESAGYAAQALRCGALGYLTKHCEPAEVIDGIRLVAAGQRALAPEMARALAREAGACPGQLASLTPREFEVLRLLAQGEPTMDIAQAMHLSPKTILNYLSLIRQKLDVDNDFKLLHLAARHGLLDMPAAVLA